MNEAVIVSIILGTAAALIGALAVAAWGLGRYLWSSHATRLGNVEKDVDALQTEVHQRPDRPEINGILSSLRQEQAKQSRDIMTAINELQKLIHEHNASVTKRIDDTMLIVFKSATKEHRVDN